MALPGSIGPLLAGAGLNIAGVARGDSYQEILPECRSVIVFASGGRGLWSAFMDDLARHPDHLLGHPDPLDDFVARTLLRVDPDPGSNRRWIRCAATETEFVDFRLLAHAAGVGWRSRLGLLLHPEYGPWLGLRLACFTRLPLPATGPLPEPNPCVDCPAPCVTACPAGAIDKQDGWNLQRCAGFHESSTLCHSACHSRSACPMGAAHQYTKMQQHYHSDRLTGRKRLAAALGIKEDDLGAGPHWEDYATVRDL